MPVVRRSAPVCYKTNRWNRSVPNTVRMRIGDRSQWVLAESQGWPRRRWTSRMEGLGKACLQVPTYHAGAGRRTTVMYNILQFVILLANVCCIGYFLYQAGKLKGLSIATSAALNHKMDKNNEKEPSHHRSAGLPVRQNQRRKIQCSICNCTPQGTHSPFLRRAPY